MPHDRPAARARGVLAAAARTATTSGIPVLIALLGVACKTDFFPRKHGSRETAPS